MLPSTVRDRCDKVGLAVGRVIDRVAKDTVVVVEGEDEAERVTEDDTVAAGAEADGITEADAVVLPSTVGDRCDNVGLTVGGDRDRVAKETEVEADGEVVVDGDVSLVGDTAREIVGDTDQDAVADADAVAAGAEDEGVGEGDKVPLRAAVVDPCDKVELGVGSDGDRVANDTVVVAEGEDDVDGEVSLMVGVTVMEIVGDDDEDTVAETDVVAAGAEVEGVAEADAVRLSSAVGLSVGGDGDRVANDSVVEMVGDADDDTVAAGTEADRVAEVETLRLPSTVGLSVGGV